jgi:hypothetical protein
MNDLIEFVVIEYTPDGGQSLPFGHFRVAPRIGEIITHDENGVGIAFEVVAVHHPSEPTATAGDLFVKRLGNLVDHLMAQEKTHTPSKPYDLSKAL